MQIPKTTDALVKDIRTGEGIFEWVLGVLIVAASATSNLSFAHGATYLTIVAGIKCARRTAIKVFAGQKSAGLGDPIPWTPPANIDQVVKEIEQEVQDQGLAQQAPGTPADQVTSGLSPSEGVRTFAHEPESAPKDESAKVTDSQVTGSGGTN